MQLAWKEMWRQKRKFTLLFLITFLISLLVILITGLADGLAYDNGAAIQRLPIESLTLADDADGQLTKSFIETDDVHGSTMSVKPFTFVIDGKKVDATLFTFPTDSPLAPIRGLKTRDVVVDSGLAEHLSVGDTVTDFNSGYEFIVSGTTFGRYSHGPVVYATNDTWFDYLQASNQPRYVSAHLETGPVGTTVVSKQTLIESVPGYQAEQQTFTMMRAFLMVIGTLMLTAFFYLFTLQKWTELGILKAIGLKTSIISASLLFQVASLVLSASVVSLGMAWMLDRVGIGTIPFRFEWGHMLTFSGLMVGLSLLGTLLPIWKLSQLDAADVIGGKVA